MFYQFSRNRLVLGIILSAILHVCLSTAVQAQSAPVRIGSDPWCPFICDTGGSQQGIMVDIAIEALALSGYEASYHNINWARVKQMIRAGEIDGIVGTSKSTPDATPYHFPETALGVAETCFFRRASDDWEYTTLQSLDSQTMGWINDYGFGNDEIDNWVIAHKGTSQLATISGENLLERIIKMMLAGRISTFAEERNVVSYELKKLGLQDKIVATGCIGSALKVYVAFSQKIGRGKELANALDDGVAKLRQNGRLAAILDTYGLTLDTWVSQ